MTLLQTKNILALTLAIAIALIFFFCFSGSALAETALSPTGESGAASVAESLNLEGLNYMLFVLFAGLGMLFAWLGGMLFDISIAIFTVGMVDTINHLGLNIAISEMWAVVRDIFNILFIFGLIAAGFKIILDVNDSASKKNIGTLVIAALLINFSLYAAQIVVDFTNVAAYQIHQMIAPASNSGWNLFNMRVHDTSSQFINLTGLDDTTRTNQAVADELSVGGDSSSVNGFFQAIMLGIIFFFFYTVLGFIFAAGAIILFTRFFSLIFLMIFSPIMLLGMIIPKLQQVSSKWTKLFINQALVGPVFLFMIYLSLRSLQGIGTTGTDGGLAAVIVYLLIVTAFLLASLKVAKSMGAAGASMAMNTGEKWGRSIRGYAGAAAGGATFGAAGRLGRSTVGRWAQGRAESDAWRDSAATSTIGRAKLNIARRLGDASFDARNTPLAANVGLGTGIKGYKTKTEESTKKIIEREKQYAESLGQVSDEDEKVSAAQLEVDATERSIEVDKEGIATRQKEITELQARKSGESKAEQEKTQLEIDQKRSEITQMRGQIETRKEDLMKQKEAVEKEKYRRQLGSSNNAPLQANRIKDAKKELTVLMTDYAKARDEKKIAKEAGNTTAEAAAEARLSEVATQIATKQKEIANHEKEAGKYDGGYASSVENLGPIKKIFLGRNSKQNEEAGKEIRKEYKKKAKVKE